MRINSVYLTDAIEEYGAHLQARGLAATTRKNAAQVLHKALVSWGNIQVSSVSDLHVDRLFTSHDWSARTRNLYMQNLRQFFKWCRLRRYMAKDYDPTDLWGAAKVPTNKDKLRIPVSQFAALLDAAPHPRDRAIVALGLFTFMRGSEISTLRVGDLDLGKSQLHITRHKTLDEDVLPVSSELAVELTRYLNWYRADQGTLLESWFLVPAKKPDPWEQGPDGLLRRRPNPASVKPRVQEKKPYRAVQRALRGIGLDVKGEGSHSLRRSGARALADSLRSTGYDGALLRVASMLGHKSTKVTEHYIGWGLERTQRNEMIAGKAMFPEMEQAPGLRVVGGFDG